MAQQTSSRAYYEACRKRKLVNSGIFNRKTQKAEGFKRLPLFCIYIKFPAVTKLDRAVGFLIHAVGFLTRAVGKLFHAVAIVTRAVAIVTRAVAFVIRAVAIVIRTVSFVTGAVVNVIGNSRRGTYVSVEPFHLSCYLDEQTFRFNERKGKDVERFIKTLESITGKRLTYKQLIGDYLSC